LFCQFPLKILLEAANPKHKLSFKKKASSPSIVIGGSLRASVTRPRCIKQGDAAEVSPVDSVSDFNSLTPLSHMGDSSHLHQPHLDEEINSISSDRAVISSTPPPPFISRIVALPSSLSLASTVSTSKAMTGSATMMAHDDKAESSAMDTNNADGDNYEGKRQANLQRNANLLQSLGLFQVHDPLRKV
jgi:hypothetical protein